MSNVSVFAVFIVVILYLHEGQTTSSPRWKRMNLHAVCFQGQGDKPGAVINYGDGKVINAVKLVYKSGFIRCSLKQSYNTRWGCYQATHTSLRKYSLNVVITDANKNKIFPLEKYREQSKLKPGIWYYLPFVDTRYSNELVFVNSMDPFYFPKNGKLYIWYGEDLANWNERDNVGKVCVDVYVHAVH